VPLSTIFTPKSGSDVGALLTIVLEMTPPQCGQKPLDAGGQFGYGMLFPHLGQFIDLVTSSLQSNQLSEHLSLF